MHDRLFAAYVLCLAVILCVCTFANEAAKRAEISYNLRLQDTLSFIAGKNQRRMIIEVHVQNLEAMLETRPDISDRARETISKGIADFKKTLDRYASDPIEKDGVKELRALADIYQRELGTAQRRLPYFTYGQVSLQIALFLLATNLILQLARLAYVVAILGIAAGLLTINGLFLVFDLERVWQSLT